MSGILNVLDFKQTSDTDYDYFQRAFDAAYGKTLLIPAGTYDISDTLIVQERTRFIGEDPFGHPKSSFIRKTGNRDEYLFRPRTDVVNSTSPAFHNIAFDGKYILDLRSGWFERTNRALIESCHFACAADEKDGVAVNLWMHDFSIISNCNFYGYQGLCAVRISGWIADTHGDSHHSTQIRVSDCVFSGSTIGISAEVVDSVKITGNDFGGSEYPIEIGGQIFLEKTSKLSIPAERIYNKNESSVPSFAGAGFFANVNIRDNHLEAFKTGVHVYGGANLNHGTRIESNNFQIGRNQVPNTTSMYFEGVDGLNTYNNEMLFGNAPADQIEHPVAGIRYRGCHNPRLVLDNFYGIISPEVGNPVLNSLGYVDEGENVNALILKGQKGGQVRLDSGPSQITGKLQLKDADLTVHLPKVGFDNWFPIDEQTLSLTRGISASKYNLMQGQAFPILPLSGNACGIAMINVFMDGIGRYFTTWAIGRNVATKISDDSSTSAYHLELDGKDLLLRHDHPTSGSAFVSGMFLGIG